MLPVLVVACATVGHARSPSHDPAFHTLPGPLAGLERIGGKGGTGAGVCRTGHGALPCRAGGRSLSKERGRPLSPFMTRKGIEGGSPGTGGAAAASSGRDWRTNQVPSSRTPSVQRTQAPRKRELPSSPSSMSRATRARPKTAMHASAVSGKSQDYQILGESILWESPYGAMTVYERTVRFPYDDPAGGNPGADGHDDPGADGHDDVPSLAKRLDASPQGKTVRWHIVGCPLGNFSSVVIFPYDSRTGTCSLIREYCPGIHEVKSGIPGGLYEQHKHDDLMNAARDELNEEAGLIGGTWFALAPEGIPQDKYSRNRLHPYLVIDSSIDLDPRAQDDTEQIEVEHGVSLDEAKRRLFAGEMPAPAAMVTLMAIDKLRELGYVR